MPNTQLQENNKVTKAIFGTEQNKIKNFAILSAENPLAIALDPAENNKRDAMLKQDLQKLGVVYKKLTGFFEGNKEHSYFIFNIDIYNWDSPDYNLGLKTIKDLAKKYGQLSFFYGILQSPTQQSSSVQVLYYELAQNSNDYELCAYMKPGTHKILSWEEAKKWINTTAKAKRDALRNRKWTKKLSKELAKSDRYISPHSESKGLNFSFDFENSSDDFSSVYDKLNELNK